MQFLPHPLNRRSGFTLIELLTVMAIIAILTGLVLSISGFVNHKEATARADAEIHALSAACENYKSDNGNYPYIVLNGTASVSYPSGSQTSGTTNIPSDQLDPRLNGNSSAPGGTGSTLTYAQASLELYVALTSDTNNTQTTVQLSGSNNYLPSIKQDMLGRSNPSLPVNAQSNPITYLSDPFGNVYGYSTANAFFKACVDQGWNPGTQKAPGYNSTFDLWSTGGLFTNPYNGPAGSSTAPGATGDPQLNWIKNW